VVEGSLLGHRSGPDLAGDQTIGDDEQAQEHAKHLDRLLGPDALPPQRVRDLKAVPDDDARAERPGGWMRFLYFYLMKDAGPRASDRATACRVPAAVGAGVTTGGPGQVERLATFQAESGVEAARLVANDPFRSEGLLERHWVKQWPSD
jgi:hypothetical protein